MYQDPPLGTNRQVSGMRVLDRRFSKIQRFDFINRSPIEKN